MRFFETQLKKQSGFTLVEIIVSTAIFVTAVSAMLGLFNYTLQINRRVQSLRELVQGTRTFAETITREIRNGRIDYGSWTSECNVANYSNAINRSLAIQTIDGDKLCFYFNGGQLYLKKQTPTGTQTALIFESPNFTVTEDTFNFIVSPKKNPNAIDPSTGQYPKIQPFVTILGQFTLNKGKPTESTIGYQTTISTDVYDTLK